MLKLANKDRNAEKADEPKEGINRGLSEVPEVDLGAIPGNTGTRRNTPSREGHVAESLLRKHCSVHPSLLAFRLAALRLQAVSL